MADGGLLHDCRDVHLWQLLSASVYEAREHIRRLREASEYIGKHVKFPSLRSFDSGFPTVDHHGSSSEPFDFSAPFGLTRGRWHKVSYDELPSLLKLFDYVRERKELKERFGVLEAPDQESTEKFLRISVAHVALEVLDHLMNTAGDDFAEADLKAAWLPLETYLLADELPVEIHVPIVLTHFEATSPVALRPNLRIEPIPIDLQLARVPDVSWGSSIHSTVLAAATHSFVFTGYVLPAGNPMAYASHRPSFYPIDRIEAAFAALRLGTEVDTGYAHVFPKPVGWVPGYTGRLTKVVYGALTRRYPSHFDNWGWLVERSAVTDAQLEVVGEVLGQLESAPRHLQLAARRLSAATLRDDEEDAIVDICVGLEAALGDQSPTEMTHKLALRVAAVLATSLDGLATREPLLTFRQAKRLYDWRSKLVHGSPDVKKARQRFEELGGGEPAVRSAGELLRRALRVVLASSDLHDSAAIDEKLIVAALQPEAEDG